MYLSSRDSAGALAFENYPPLYILVVSLWREKNFDRSSLEDDSVAAIYLFYMQAS